MSVILDQLEDIAKKMQKGTATIEEADKFRFLSCQQIIQGMKIGGTEDLMKKEKAELIPAIDAIAFLMFPDEYEINPKLVEIDGKA